MEILKSLGLSLCLTLLIEMSLAALFRVRTKRGLLIVFLANLLTNPAVVFLCGVSGPYLGKWFLPFQLTLELIAVLVEGNVYRRFSKEMKAALPPFVLSLVLNACSYGTGILLTALL